MATAGTRFFRPQCGHVITFVDMLTSSGVVVTDARIVVADAEFAVDHSDTDDRTVLNVAGEQGAPDAGLHLAGDETAEWAGTVDGIEAMLRR